MGIAYSDYVKRPNQEHEYTQEEIIELALSEDDIFHFYKHVKIVNPDQGRIIYDPYDYQKDITEMVLENRFTSILCARQAGKSTTIGAYIMHYACFNADKYIGIASNTAASAQDILARIKIMYEELPNYLKPGIIKYNEKSIIFDNGTSIVATATTKDAFRGRTINLLFLDEFAFVPVNQARDFYNANYPTISASKTGKIIIVSTPNGIGNLFHKIYSNAEKNINSFKDYKADWRAVPGRDEAWAKETRTNMGERGFNQEMAVHFLGSVGTIISSDTLEWLTQQKSPENVIYDLEDRLRIYKKPEKGCRYVLGVDPSKGVGGDDATIQILKIENINPIRMEQVAVFQDNLTDIYELADIVNKLSFYYNKAKIMVENNGEGAPVALRLWWTHENEGLVNSGRKNKDLGIRATQTTKVNAVLLMKKLIEDHSIKLVDEDTIFQLTDFQDIKGKMECVNMHDDLVSSLYWAIYIIEMNVLDRSDIIPDTREEIGYGILTDNDENMDGWENFGSSHIGISLYK